MLPLGAALVTKRSDLDLQEKRPKILLLLDASEEIVLHQFPWLFEMASTLAFWPFSHLLHSLSTMESLMKAFFLISITQSRMYVYNYL